MRVNLVWATPNGDQLIAELARVSNPDNQKNTETAPKLLRYLLDHKHFSPFEMAHACVEIETTRDISRQILRHRSFSFQEFSGRYAKYKGLSYDRELRLQDTKNRQNSIEVGDCALKGWWESNLEDVATHCQTIYHEALEKGVAKEVARALLPEGLTPTRMYMVGSMRSWYHYWQVRCTPDTQKEMRNGPVLWECLLTDLNRYLGEDKIIAGGAIRDFVMKLGEPKDIDVFMPRGATDYTLGDEFAEVPNPGVQHDEYHGRMRGIERVKTFHYYRCDMPVQIISIGAQDPVNFVKGFDLGTSKCYYRGAVVLGKDFLNDWHHAQITILPSVFEQDANNVERSRQRARALALRYANAPRIVEMNLAEGPLMLGGPADPVVDGDIAPGIDPMLVGQQWAEADVHNARLQAAQGLMNAVRNIDVQGDGRANVGEWRVNW